MKLIKIASLAAMAAGTLLAASCGQQQQQGAGPGYTPPPSYAGHHEPGPSAVDLPASIWGTFTVA